MSDKRGIDPDSGAFSGKDASALNQNHNLASKALAEFKKKNYTQALITLSKLSDLKNESYELKLIHNKAVVEFYKSDFRNVEQLITALQYYFDRANVLANKFHNADYCVSFMNRAILDYFTYSYTSSLRIVERLLFFTESMDEIRITMLYLLLLELYACTNQPQKGLNFIVTTDNFVTKEIVVEKKSDMEKVAIKEALRVESCKYSAQFHLQIYKLDDAITQFSLLNESKNVKYICLKALIQFQKKEYQTALQTIISLVTSKSVNTVTAAISFNNQAVIYYKLGKLRLAKLFIDRALCIDRKLNRPIVLKSLNDMGLSKQFDLSYNYGLILFQKRDFINAFEHLILAVQRFHRNPRIWLRLAECCVQITKPNESSLTRIEIIGHGVHRKLILPSQRINDPKFGYRIQTYAVTVPTIEFAILCLKNALSLIQCDSEFSFDQAVPSILSNDLELPPSVSGNSCPTNPFTAEEKNDLHNAILLLSAYVHLTVGNYIVVKEKVDLLLKRKKVNLTQRLLAHLYVAKSLINMNRTQDALKYVNPDQFKNAANNNYFKDFNFNGHFLIRYNLAVTYAMRGEYQTALNNLNNLAKDYDNADQPQPIALMILMVYIKLQTGDAKSARTILEKAYRQQEGIQEPPKPKQQVQEKVQIKTNKDKSKEKPAVKSQPKQTQKQQQQQQSQKQQQKQQKKQK